MGWLQRFFQDLRAGAADAAPSGDPARVAAVEAVLAELAPLVAADGGSIRLAAVKDDGTVEVRLRGACAHCHASPTTLAAIEPRLRDACAWFRGVRAV
jgi:Fe-S cluster biogenesis protein NfuA